MNLLDKPNVTEASIDRLMKGREVMEKLRHSDVHKDVAETLVRLAEDNQTLNHRIRDLTKLVDQTGELLSRMIQVSESIAARYDEAQRKQQ